MRIVVRDVPDGKVLDQSDTRDSDAMKWVTGWIDDDRYLFWGADTGTSWVRKYESGQWLERPMDAESCRTLERLFEAKYGEHRGNCLLPKSNW